MSATSIDEQGKQSDKNKPVKVLTVEKTDFSWVGDARCSKIQMGFLQKVWLEKETKLNGSSEESKLAYGSWKKQKYGADNQLLSAILLQRRFFGWRVEIICVKARWNFFKGI